MRKLIISTQMTIDGVIDDVDKWLTWHGEHTEHDFDLLYSADALLLGRKVYEGLSVAWPGMTDDSGFAERINSIPKHIASKTLDDDPLKWNATVLKGDLVESVSNLKQQPGGNLVSYGCGELAHELVTHNLADEVLLYVHPVVWGRGQRPFHGRAPVHLRLVATTSFDSGVTLLTYHTGAERRNIHGSVAQRS
jgi:dihydrofolate reductase